MSCNVRPQNFSMLFNDSWWNKVQLARFAVQRFEKFYYLLSADWCKLGLYSSAVSRVLFIGSWHSDKGVQLFHFLCSENLACSSPGNHCDFAVSHNMPYAMLCDMHSPCNRRYVVQARWAYAEPICVPFVSSKWVSFSTNLSPQSRPLTCILSPRSVEDPNHEIGTHFTEWTE